MMICRSEACRVLHGAVPFEEWIHTTGLRGNDCGATFAFHYCPLITTKIISAASSVAPEI